MKNSVRLFSTVTVMVLVLALATPAGATEHNQGFFLRLTGGGGFASTSISDPASIDLKLSGLGGGMTAAIGGIVSPNLALHGNVWGWFVSDPDATINGLDAGQLGSSLNMSAVGGGATYYFMPTNVYVTGALGVGKLSTNGGSSDAGVVFDLALGKEWWVSPKWGLGLNAGVQYHNMPDGGVDQSWSGTTFVLSFSATLN